MSVKNVFQNSGQSSDSVLISVRETSLSVLSCVRVTGFTVINILKSLLICRYSGVCVLAVIT